MFSKRKRKRHLIFDFAFRIIVYTTLISSASLFERDLRNNKSVSRFLLKDRVTTRLKFVLLPQLAVNMGEKRSFEILSEEKFAEIYRAFWKKLYSAGYNLLRDKTLAQELVQDVFVKLWLNRNEIKQVENMEAYLLRALRNKIYDHFDSVACREKHHKRALENFSEEHNAVDDIVIFNEGMRVMGDVLRTMPQKTQTVFRLSKFHRYTHEEIAAKTHLSSKAVEYHITQAIKKLRIRLAIFLS
jgi:RNA polymerase sigma-70 factor (family 1)